MSVLVAGLCYEIPFGCPKRKAIAVALADHASHDGTKVFPAISLIAKKVEFSERTVQRTLRELEALGVLIIVRPGGAGPKDTREWAFDLTLLRDLASGAVIIRENKGDSETPSEGDSLSPLEVVRVTETELRVTGSSAKGDSSVTRTVTNHQIEPSTGGSAPATQGAARSSPDREARLIRKGDPEWRLWMIWLSDAGQAKAVQAFETEGAMVVMDERPREFAEKPKLPPLDQSKLALLEANRIERLRKGYRDPTGEAA